MTEEEFQAMEPARLALCEFVLDLSDNATDDLKRKLLDVERALTLYADAARPQKPVGWGLLNPVTGKLGMTAYVREDSAKRGAIVQSNRWNRFIAVPLFLAPDFAAHEKPRQP